MKAEDMGRATGLNEAELERRERFAVHIRRQRLFQSDVRWSQDYKSPSACQPLLVPNELTCELEPLICGID